MEFKKLYSIENHDENDSLNRWIREYPELVNDTEFILTDKLDGASFQIIFTNDSVQYATRKRLIEPGEPFYDWEEVITEKCALQIEHIHDVVKNSDAVDTLRLYGELYGGNVQGFRIDYGSEKDFLPFGMQVNDEDISVKEAKEWLQSIGIPEDWWVPTVTITTSLKAALEFEVENVKTKITNGDLRESHKSNRNIEGVVITPYDKVFTRTDNHADGPSFSIFRIKKKCKAFSDKKPSKNRKPKAPRMTMVNPELQKLIDIYEGYFNLNRVIDLESKEGPITSRRQINTYMNLLCEDAADDFQLKYKEQIRNLNKNDKSALFKAGIRISVDVLVERIKMVEIDI